MKLAVCYGCIQRWVCCVLRLHTALGVLCLTAAYSVGCAVSYGCIQCWVCCVLRLHTALGVLCLTAAYNVGLSAVCYIKKLKDELQLFVASSEIVKGLFKGQTLK